MEGREMIQSEVPSTKRPVALVTGAGRRSGAAACSAFAAAGYAVAVTDIDASAAGETAHALTAAGATAISMAHDVTSTESTDAAIAGTLEQLDRVDALVNNAGIIEPGPSAGISDESWSRLLAVHLDGTFRCSRAAHPALAIQGGDGR
jgi:3-oxoacyl-[acyl-carrier protein] reductase